MILFVNIIVRTEEAKVTLEPFPHLLQNQTDCQCYGCLVVVMAVQQQEKKNYKYTNVLFSSSSILAVTPGWD